MKEVGAKCLERKGIGRMGMNGKWEGAGRALCLIAGALALLAVPVLGQLVDRTKAPNAANEGIAKSLADEIGTGRGDEMTPNSSMFIIRRDPFRAIRRGRQLFQRKFTRADGQGPAVGDGSGDINSNLAIGAGLSDSCAACHGRPRGSAGAGGDVVTRPDSRDAPHLFGLGLKEMLADEITADLRAIQGQAVASAKRKKSAVTLNLFSKGIDYGRITALPDGSLDTSQVRGVDRDLRVRPFFAHGGTVSIREFIVGAAQNEMGLQSADPDLAIASAGGRVITPSGMILDGSLDRIEAPPTTDPAADPDHDGVSNELPASLVDYLEYYLMNYFKPALYKQTDTTREGRRLFMKIGCSSCHMPDLLINHDRRVADVETAYNTVNGVFNNLFAKATTLVRAVDDGSGLPPIIQPKLQPYLVQNIFTDFKRHDLGPSFYERNYDGSMQTQWLTRPLWGVGNTAPYGHDGRSVNLTEVILRHDGEAGDARNGFIGLSDEGRDEVVAFLNSLVLFAPDDTASNLDPGNRNAPFFPQFGHGSIKLSLLFLNPKDPE